MTLVAIFLVASHDAIPAAFLVSRSLGVLLGQE